MSSVEIKCSILLFLKKILTSRDIIAECGTENGWAKAWNADPQVICQGAIYVMTNWTFK